MFSIGVNPRAPGPAALGFAVVVAVMLPANTFGDTFRVPEDAASIGQAILLSEDSAAVSDIIKLSADTYEENLVIPSVAGKSLTIQADDGDKVIIQGASGQSALIAVGASTSVTLAGLILQNAGTVVEVNTGSTLILRGSVLTGGAAGSSVGVGCIGTVSITVEQVTLYGLGKGIDCEGLSSFNINRNIFSTISGIPISVTPGVGNFVLTNLFFETGPGGVQGDDVLEEGDPLFVDIDNLDFHLRAGSAALRDEVDREDDVGAYGGLLAGSAVPFAPPQPSISCVLPPGSDCTVRWANNLDYSVVRYLVFSSAPSAPSPDYGTPQSVAQCPAAQETCSTTFSGLPPLDPVNDRPGQTGTPTTRIGDSRVELSWPAVPTATEYEVYVAAEPDCGTLQDVEPQTYTSTSRVINQLSDGTPLDNDATYCFQVRAKRQPKLHAAVKSSYDEDSTTTGASDLSESATAPYGSALFGDFSGVVNATPREVDGFPPLEDMGGCFIATAAYGSALAPQVDVLRAFRDQYLRPVAAGRVVVRMYETWSPSLAEVVRSSEPLRLIVRILLWPVIGLAWIAVYAPWWALLVAGVGAAILWPVLMRWRGAMRA